MPVRSCSSDEVLSEHQPLPCLASNKVIPFPTWDKQWIKTHKTPAVIAVELSVTHSLSLSSHSGAESASNLPCLWRLNVIHDSHTYSTDLTWPQPQCFLQLPWQDSQEVWLDTFTHSTWRSRGYYRACNPCWLVPLALHSNPVQAKLSC